MEKNLHYNIKTHCRHGFPLKEYCHKCTSKEKKLNDILPYRKSEFAYDRRLKAGFKMLDNNGYLSEDYS